jgi:hypothetical protein
MISEAEIELAGADENLAAAEHNIRLLASLIPQLAHDGYATTEVEGQLHTMTQTLHYLQAERHAIVASLDGNQSLPRVARQQPGSTWKALYARLSWS